MAEHGAPKGPRGPIVAVSARGIPNPGGRGIVGVSASLLMIVVSVVLLRASSWRSALA